jgi:hypothetical protein
MTLSSIVCGLLFVLLLHRLVKDYSGLGTKYILPFILIVLAVSVRQFTPHFTSGMDTFFGMAYFTLFILLLKKYETGKFNLIYVVVCGALLFWVRPELLIFSFLSALFLFFGEKDKNKKKKNLIVLISLPAGIFIMFFLSNEFFGSYLPLPFYVKVANSYGMEFEEVYRFTPYIQIAAFIIHNWILFTLSAVGIIFRKTLLIKFSPVEKALISGTIVYFIFNLFFVTQIMYYYQRFYYPVLPVLFYISAKSLSAVIEKREFISVLVKWRTIKIFKIVSVFIISGSFAYGILFVSIKFYSDIREGRFARLDTKYVYEKVYKKDLLGSDQLAEFPFDLKIATTEVGFVSAINLDKEVIDLAGLNNKEIAREGLNVDIFFIRHQPDVLYLPHPHYKKMISDIINYPFFKENYDYFSAEILGTGMGVSIYRKSKYYEELKKIFQVK